MAGKTSRSALLGRAVRARRQELGLTQPQLAEQVRCSKSVISRLERGERLPDVNVISRLDAQLGGEGKLREAWRRALLERPSNTPAYRTRWSHNYPAKYTGEVWMAVALHPAATATRTDLEVRWGPWVLRSAVTWPSERSVSAWHTKGDDGLSIPVIVRAAHAISVEFNCGPAPDDAIDFNPGWVWDGR